MAAYYEENGVRIAVPEMESDRNNPLFSVSALQSCLNKRKWANGRQRFGVGVNYPDKDKLPDWVKGVLTVIDMGDGGNFEEVAEIGYRGSIFYEFINPNEQPKE